MATVDLVCSYDAAGGDAWTNGSNISVNNSSYASISGVNGGSLRALGFTTNASSAIPAGAVISSVQLIARFSGLYLCTYSMYVKNPGGFADGGAAGHTLTWYGSTLSGVLTSSNLGTERPAVLTDSLTSGYIRMFHDEYGYPNDMYVEYLSLRVTSTEGGVVIPLMFMNENM